MYSVGVCIQTIESVLPAGLSLDVLDGVPFILGDVLGHEGVGRLDVGELAGHDQLQGSGPTRRKGSIKNMFRTRGSSVKNNH